MQEKERETAETARRKARADRIAKARSAAGFRFKMDAVRMLGIPQTTYYGWEGGAEIDADTARRLGELFGVKPEWILYGDGEPEAALFKVPVVGVIGAGGTIETMSEQFDSSTPLYEIEVPFQLPPDALALEIRGDSMYPRYDNGDVIICRKFSEDIEVMIGREAAVATDIGNRYLKKVLKGTRPGLFDLESHNAPLMRDQRITWASPVNTVVRSGQWRALTPGNRASSNVRPVRA
ncbi:S24 family peptidase [Bosea massiliensis]|uniref:S24 family peptidase n=1 Tax=Bosea massiliensis TaxID=151419 RepID=A0ABW0PBB2_9HYPH